MENSQPGNDNGEAEERWQDQNAVGPPIPPEQGYRESEKTDGNDSPDAHGGHAQFIPIGDARVRDRE
jgi:hypothetical protein